MSISELKKSKIVHLKTLVQKAVNFSTESKLHGAKEAFKNLDSVIEDFHSNLDTIDLQINDAIVKKTKKMQEARMMEVYAEKKALKDLRTKYEELVDTITKDGEVSRLEKELSYFREHALKSSKLLEAKDSQIKSLRRRIVELESEKKYLDEYTKFVSKKAEHVKLDRFPTEADSPKEVLKVKAGSSRHERASSSIRQRVQTGNSTKDGSRTFWKNKNSSFTVSRTELLNDEPQNLESFLKSLEQRSLDDKYVLIDEIRKFCRRMIESYEHTAQKARKDLTKDRTDINNTSAMSPHNDIAEIFTGCVEQIKKSRIRPYSTNSDKQSFSLNHSKNESKLRNISLGSADKHKLLELFVSNEYIVEAIARILSSKKQDDDQNLCALADSCVSVENTADCFSDALITSEFEHAKRAASPVSKFRSQAIFQHSETANTPKLNNSSIAKIAELDETLKSEDFVENSKLINAKLAKIQDSAPIPLYKRRRDKILKNIIQAHKF